MSYNTTQLNPDKEFERHVFHRDQFAHYLRWSFVLKLARARFPKPYTVLDLGCGSGNLCEVLYRNRLPPTKYLGLEYKKTMVQTCQEKFKKVPWASFSQADLTISLDDYKGEWDFITSFEVLEHVGKANVEAVLDNFKRLMGEHTTLLISTPCYDAQVGAAKNHIVDGVIGELTFHELYGLLEKRFKIKRVYGTFASIKDYEPHLVGWQRQFFNKTKEYFDTNLLSVIMAPMFPEYSRNCIWELGLS